jgi:molybdate transport system ATP-binding protein
MARPPRGYPSGVGRVIAFDCRVARPGFAFDVAFRAGPGVTALFGPSGSGKTTAIRLLAGLMRPDQGRIVVDGATLLDTAVWVAVPAHRRRIGVVFQDALLLPHLSVRANLTYGRWFTAPSARRIGFDPVVEVLGIGSLLARRPETLSGGERQRVAIGRALLMSPRLLLMDEPLASLDAARKREILPFIERLRDEFAIPIVYVSHAVEEVARLADHVVRLERGRVAAAGTPAAVLGPAAPLTDMDRFDALSILTATVAAYRADYDVTLLEHPAGRIVLPGRVRTDGAVRVVIRATNVALAVGAPGPISVRTVLQGQLTALETDAGPIARATIRLAGGETLQAYATRLATDSLGLAVGQPVQALVKAVTIDERGVAGAQA